MFVSWKNKKGLCFTMQIDEEDLHLLKGRKPHINSGYAYVWVSRKHIDVARLVMQCPKGMHVDHVNHDQLDNRRCNLRICTHNENQRNRLKHTPGSSVYKGVSWIARCQKWTAHIRISRNFTHLGYFLTEREAALAYNDKAKQCFGEYACLNVVE